MTTVFLWIYCVIKYISAVFVKSGFVMAYKALNVPDVNSLSLSFMFYLSFPWYNYVLFICMIISSFIICNIFYFLMSDSFTQSVLCCPHQADCNNYIRLLEFLGDGRIYACGTYAFDPQCAFVVSVFAFMFISPQLNWLCLLTHPFKHHITDIPHDKHTQRQMAQRRIDTTVTQIHVYSCVFMIFCHHERY